MRNKLSVFILIVMGISIVGIFFLQVVLSASAAVAGEKIRALENKKVELTLACSQLKMEVEKASSLAQIETTAREKLQMVDSTQRVFFITPDYLAKGESDTLN